MSNRIWFMLQQWKQKRQAAVDKRRELTRRLMAEQDKDGLRKEVVWVPQTTLPDPETLEQYFKEQEVSIDKNFMENEREHSKD